MLVDRVGRIVCVEIDRDLHGILAARFQGEGPRPAGNEHDARDLSGVTLIHGDVLAGKHGLAPEISALIKSYDGGDGGCVKLVANLPYQVATPLVMNLLIDYPEVRRLCFTVQAEVGERITASPGCKAFGPLSIISQSLSKIEVLAHLRPETFWPRPTVHSVMIRMDVIDPPLPDRESVHRFVSLVRGTFEHRRKILRSALGYVVDPAARDRVGDRFDGTRRPESFSVDEWLDLYRTIESE